MKEQYLIKQFAIGLRTGAIKPKRTAPLGITKDDLTPEELEDLKKWEEKCDQEALTPIDPGGSEFLKRG